VEGLDLSGGRLKFHSRKLSRPFQRKKGIPSCKRKRPLSLKEGGDYHASHGKEGDGIDEARGEAERCVFFARADTEGRSEEKPVWKNRGICPFRGERQANADRQLCRRGTTSFLEGKVASIVGGISTRKRIKDPRNQLKRGRGAKGGKPCFFLWRRIGRPGAIERGGGKSIGGKKGGGCLSIR